MEGGGVRDTAARARCWFRGFRVCGSGFLCSFSRVLKLFVWAASARESAYLSCACVR